MPKLGQIFYGRSRDGYGVLGASPLGRPYVGFVAAVCRAVGSPDRPGDIQPFLISKREGRNVIMIRVCRGDADPTGRSTLFFHAVVAPVDALTTAKLDAFVFAEKGVFLSSLPNSVDDIEVAISANRDEVSPSGELHYPAFVSSDRPLDIEVHRVLGRETLTRNWATYSYRPLDGFDVCVHSSYASSPAFGNRYALKNGHFVAVDNSHIEFPNPQLSSRKKDSLLMFKVSLFVNVVLVVLSAFLVLRNGGKGSGEHPFQMPSQVQTDQSDQTKTKSSREITKEEAFGKWGKEWEAEFRQSLRTSFEKKLGDKRPILDFENKMLLVDPYYMDYKKQKATPATPEALDVYATLKAYVSFVESEVLTLNQEGKNDENNKSKR